MDLDVIGAAASGVWRCRACEMTCPAWLGSGQFDLCAQCQDDQRRRERAVIAATEAPDERPVNRDQCPQCRGALLTRVNTRNGSSFLGCRNYPRCRYTRALRPSRERRAA